MDHGGEKSMIYLFDLNNLSFVLESIYISHIILTLSQKGIMIIYKFSLINIGVINEICDKNPYYC